MKVFQAVGWEWSTVGRCGCIAERGTTDSQVLRLRLCDEEGNGAVIEFPTILAQGDFFLDGQVQARTTEEDDNAGGDTGA